MPRGLNNWTFRDVRDLLVTHGFHLSHVEGSHYFYVGIVDGVGRQVCLPFHAAKALHPKTMKGIVLQSGIPLKEWGGK